MASHVMYVSPLSNPDYVVRVRTWIWRVYSSTGGSGLDRSLDWPIADTKYVLVVYLVESVRSLM